MIDKYTKKAFTLIEMIISVTILALILTVVLSIYFTMQKLRTDVFAKSILIKNTNSLIEKVNLIMKNYTIDYEEYFNRRIVWCVWNNWWDDFIWNVWTWWYCKNFTTYWNENSVDSNTWKNIIYYCSSKWKEIPQSHDCEWNNWNWISGINYIIDQDQLNLINWSGCWENVWWTDQGAWKIQSFGEYAAQFWDLKWNADWLKWCRWDDDDTDLWNWPIAVWDNLHVKELYLISKDWKKRIFIRRKLISQEDFSNDWVIQTWERLYKLQILKLRWFNVWSFNYSSDSIRKKINTWACDKQEWFICNWRNVTSDWSYPWYKLPNDVDDGRVDLTINDLTVRDFNLSIFPTIDPNLWWVNNNIQIYPYLTVNLSTQFYPTNYRTKLNPERLIKYKMNLQTTFSIKPY